MTWSSNRFGLSINSNYRSQFRALSQQEKIGLENDLIENGGAIDPVVVRKQTNEILDGHNRFEICEARRLPYRVVSVDLPNEDACLTWIQKKQFHRRNMSQAEKEQATAMLYEQLSKQNPNKHKKPNNTENDAGATNPKKEEFAPIQQVSEATGEPKRTVHRRLQRAKLTDKLAPKVKADYESGKLALSDKQLKAISTLPKHEQAATYSAVVSGDFKNITDALVATGALPKPEEKPEQPSQPEATEPEIADLSSKGAGDAIKACEKLIRLIDVWGKNSPGQKYDHARAKVDDLFDCLQDWAKSEDGAL